MSKIKIGIDPGVQTGVCLIYGKIINHLFSCSIHEAIFMVEEKARCNDEKIHIRVEDARKRKWYGENANEKKQGAGGIKRDCQIWEDYLTDLCKQYPNITFEMTHPIKNGTKLNAKQFEKITGVKKSNEHSRDACMLIWGL